MGMLNIAVEGCCHGELDTIYATLQQIEATKGIKIHLLLVCGDFQCTRNEGDLLSLAVPPKYRNLMTFPSYFSGEKTAPIPTVFIGGNHEASNVLQSLYYGGFVAPNIYFMGFSGSIEVAGIRIAGLSGIFNNSHYRQGHHESPPYDEPSLRSVYHIREYEVFKLAHLQHHTDICLSHDWPAKVWEYGDQQTLLRVKPYFREDIETGKLGNPPAMQLMKIMKPKFWFSAHLHVKFAAVVPHLEGEVVSGRECTRFLALDKVLPRGDFLQVIQIPTEHDVDDAADIALEFDPVWLAVLKKTHNLLSTDRRPIPLPQTAEFVSEDEVRWVRERLRSQLGYAGDERLKIPTFEEAMAYLTSQQSKQVAAGGRTSPGMCGDAQTDMLLHLLELDHRWTQSVCVAAEQPVTVGGEQSTDPHEIDIDDL